MTSATPTGIQAVFDADTASPGERTLSFIGQNGFNATGQARFFFEATTLWSRSTPSAAPAPRCRSSSTVT